MAKSNYPRKVNVDGNKLTFRLMQTGDRETLLARAKRLAEEDLLFMRRDITQPDAVDDWIHDIERNHAFSILVEDAGNIVAYGTLYHHQLFWNRHIAEIRVLVSSRYRSRGLGKAITQTLMREARDVNGIEKVLIYMAVDNKAARRMAEESGFQAEAILSEWVKTRDNRKHDLLIMSASLDDLNL